jgi:hypothetical protein
MPHCAAAAEAGADDGSLQILNAGKRTEREEREEET